MPIARLRVYFGPYELDARAGELYKHQLKIKLQGHPIQILAMLLERPGELITREEITQKLWPSESETFVDFEHGLNTAVRKLRQALGDEAETPQYIETLPRRGYRFVGVLTERTQAEDHSEQPRKNEDSPDGAAWGTADKVSGRSAWARRVWKAMAIAGCMAVLAAIAWWGVVSGVRWPGRERTAEMTLTPLTAVPGNVTSPAFSPDGSQIAFAWDIGVPGHGYDLYVKTMDSDTLLRLTSESSRRMAVAWSPDGRNIAITRVGGPLQPGIYLVAPTGGPARKLTMFDFNDNATDLSWSADGKLLAFTDHPANAAWERSLGLFTIAVETGERKEIATGCSLVTLPAFAPHDDRLAWVCVDSWSRFSIHVTRLRDGRDMRILDHADGIGGIAWSRDGKKIVFTSPLDFGDLKEVQIDNPNVAKKLPMGHEAAQIAVDPSRDRLAYVEGVLNLEIWRIILEEANAVPQKLILSSRQEKSPNISPDGRKIAFESTRSGSNELWVCEADGTGAVQLSHFGIRSTGSPRWSPDSTLIAFDSRAKGEARIYVMDAAREVSRELQIRNVRGSNMPNWSRDGQWIYFVHGEDEHNPSIWRVPAQGGEATEVVPAPATYPVESPDGTQLLFVRGWRLWRCRPDGSAVEMVKTVPKLKLLGDKWVPYGNGIYYLADEGGRTHLKFVDMASGAVRQVTVLPGAPPLWMGQMSISSDGKWLVYPQVDLQSSNLTMIENWK